MYRIRVCAGCQKILGSTSRCWYAGPRSVSQMVLVCPNCGWATSTGVAAMLVPGATRSWTIRGDLVGDRSVVGKLRTGTGYLRSPRVRGRRVSNSRSTTLSAWTSVQTRRPGFLRLIIQARCGSIVCVALTGQPETQPKDTTFAGNYSLRPPRSIYRLRRRGQ